MKEEIEELIIEAKIGNMSVATASQRILDLFAVSGSFCNCESLEKELHYGYGLPVCFKCNKVVKLQNDH